MHFKIQTDNLMQLDEETLCYSLLFPDDVSLFLFWAKVVIYESYSVPVRYKNITRFFFYKNYFRMFLFLTTQRGCYQPGNQQKAHTWTSCFLSYFRVFWIVRRREKLHYHQFGNCLGVQREAQERVLLTLIARNVKYKLYHR